jgi:glycine/D-amino acid oxidase-like deaminating enzyme
MNSQTFPNTARAVIIGGGVIGCSVAYHLAKLGWRDVVLLEQGRLTCGTTWHAAGLVGQLRAHQNMTRLVQYSAQLYQTLEAETGQATGWKQCGSILVARTPERVTLFRRIASAARAQGVACEMMSLEEAARKYPVMRTGDLLGALWLPDDAKVNPADVTQALAKGAHGRCAHLRADARNGGAPEERSCDRRFDHAGRHQGRGGDQLRGPVGEAGRAHVWRDRAAALGRAHVHRHRPHRRRAPGFAGAARSRRLHLREGGSRRPADGRLRAGGEAMGDGWHSGEFRVRHAAGRLGPVPDPDGERAGSPPMP